MRYTDIIIEDMHFNQNKGSFIIREKELKKLGLSSSDLYNPDSPNFQRFQSMICQFVSSAIFKSRVTAFLCSVCINEHNDAKIEFERVNSETIREMQEELEEDEEDVYDRLYDDCPFCDPDLEEDQTGKIGLVETYNFSDCIKTIDLLKTVVDKKYEVFHIDDIYYINVSVDNYEFSKEMLSEFGVDWVHSEHYIKMIRALAQERKASVFFY